MKEKEHNQEEQENNNVNNAISFPMTTKEMYTFFKEKTSLHMGNNFGNEETQLNGESNENSILKKKFQFDGFDQRANGESLIFFAGTDKARV